MNEDNAEYYKKNVVHCRTLCLLVDRKYDLCFEGFWVGPHKKFIQYTLDCDAKIQRAFFNMMMDLRDELCYSAKEQGDDLVVLLAWAL